MWHVDFVIAGRRTWAWLCLSLLLVGGAAAVGLYAPVSESGDSKPPLIAWALFIGLVWLVARDDRRRRVVLLLLVAFVSAQAWISYSAAHCDRNILTASVGLAWVVSVLTAAEVAAYLRFRPTSVWLLVVIATVPIALIISAVTWYASARCGQY